MNRRTEKEQVLNNAYDAFHDVLVDAALDVYDRLGVHPFRSREYAVEALIDSAKQHLTHSNDPALWLRMVDEEHINHLAELAKRTSPGRCF